MNPNPVVVSPIPDPIIIIPYPVPGLIKTSMKDKITPEQDISIPNTVTITVIILPTDVDPV
jgi:hypothetical protein